ncbi:MAG: hypothetical protein JOZ95_18425 [Solirubrobacterales bacterium]|nr:hypothetical protein [Solirubrobacterales bacterium]
MIGNLVTMLRCRERSNATTIRRGAGRTFRTPDGARRIRPADLGSAWQETLISALGRLDYTPQAARQALARSIADGWLRAERRERRSRVLLTPGTSTMLTSGADRIYSFGRSWDWDGQWLLVVLRVPEQSRHVRHRIRSQLAWAGFGSLGGRSLPLPSCRAGGGAAHARRQQLRRRAPVVPRTIRRGLGDSRTSWATLGTSMPSPRHTTSSSRVLSACAQRRLRPCFKRRRISFTGGASSLPGPGSAGNDAPARLATLAGLSTV